MAVFLQGCNLNCRYCHNPETINICDKCGQCILNCPSKALEKKNEEILWDKEKCSNCDNCIKFCKKNSSPKTIYYTVDELLDKLFKISPFISGITFSGGECTLQHEFIADFFRNVKQKYQNLTCFVDTNGFEDFSKNEYKSLLEFTDAFMLDVKAFDNEEHILLTGKENRNILKNLEFLGNIHKLYEVRTVIIPEFLCNTYTVDNVSRIISKFNTKYKLIKYRAIGVKDKEIIKLPSPSDEIMKNLKEIAKTNGVKEVFII